MGNGLGNAILFNVTRSRLAVRRYCRYRTRVYTFFSTTSIVGPPSEEPDLTAQSSLCEKALGKAAGTGLREPKPTMASVSAPLGALES